MSSAWAVVRFAHTYDKEVQQGSATWQELAQALTTFQLHDGEKKTLPAWSPARYRPGASRGAAGVLSLSALVLDYDNGTSIDTALDCWGWRPGMLHTSWSHELARPRFRVIMPLAEPVPAEDWAAVYAWAERWSATLDNPQDIQTPEDYHKATHSKAIDAKCKDPGRLYYLPAISSDKAPRYATSWQPCTEYLGTHAPWAKQLQALRAERARKAARPKPPRRVTVPASIARRKVRERLRTVPSARLDLGQALGGQVSGARVRHIPCPQCGRASVWFLIEPETKTSASCNHGNSCGWWGSLYDLGSVDND
jgi:hypothetical protein